MRVRLPAPLSRLGVAAAGLLLVLTGACDKGPGSSGASPAPMAAPRPRPARRVAPRRVRRPPPRRASRPAVAPAPRAACLRKGRLRTLRLASLSRVSFWGRQGRVRRAVWRKRAPFLGDDGQVQRVKGGFLAAWVQPERGSPWRQPQVGEARRKGLGFVGIRRLALARGWTGTEILGTALRELDGDGRPELLVWYRWVSGPAQKPDTRTVERLAVVDLKGPKLQGLVDLGQAPGVVDKTGCEALVRLGDLRCAGKPSLYVTRTCPGRGAKPGAAGSPKRRYTTVELRYDASEDRYAAPARFGAPDRPSSGLQRTPARVH